MRVIPVTAGSMFVGMVPCFLLPRASLGLPLAPASPFGHLLVFAAFSPSFWASWDLLPAGWRFFACLFVPPQPYPCLALFPVPFGRPFCGTPLLTLP